jgi:DNA-binding transcriptional ArsR family regulator
MKLDEPPRSGLRLAAACARPGTRTLSPEGALAAARLRELRERSMALGGFPVDDAPWQIALTLFVAGDLGEQVGFESLCRRSSVQAAAAGRWLLAMEKNGLVVRIGDLNEPDRMRVYLSAAARTRLRALFASWLAAEG